MYLAYPSTSTAYQFPGRMSLGEAAPGANVPLTRVTDAQIRQIPFFSAICRIVVRDGKGMSVGSGLLVGPSHVLTCAHVISPPEMAPGATKVITVFPGQNGPDENATAYQTNGWAVNPRWAVNDCMKAGEDYGIIRLVKKHGYVPITPFYLSNLTKYPIEMAGYPSLADLDPARLVFRSSGSVQADKGKFLFQMGSCTISQVPDPKPGDPDAKRTIENWNVTAASNGHAAGTMIVHNSESAPSMSGAPMWQVDGAGRRIVVALHRDGAGRGAGNRRAVLLNDAVRSKIKDWMRLLPDVPATRK